MASDGPCPDCIHCKCRGGVPRTNVKLIAVDLVRARMQHKDLWDTLAEGLEALRRSYELLRDAVPKDTATSLNAQTNDKIAKALKASVEQSRYMLAITEKIGQQGKYIEGVKSLFEDNLNAVKSQQPKNWIHVVSNNGVNIVLDADSEDVSFSVSASPDARIGSGDKMEFYVEVNPKVESEDDFDAKMPTPDGNSKFIKVLVKYQDIVKVIEVVTDDIVKLDRFPVGRNAENGKVFITGKRNDNLGKKPETEEMDASKIIKL